MKLERSEAECLFATSLYDPLTPHTEHDLNILQFLPPSISKSAVLTATSSSVCSLDPIDRVPALTNTSTSSVRPACSQEQQDALDPTINVLHQALLSSLQRTLQVTPDAIFDLRIEADVAFPQRGKPPVVIAQRTMVRERLGQDTGGSEHNSPASLVNGVSNSGTKTVSTLSQPAVATATTSGPPSRTPGCRGDFCSLEVAHVRR